MMRKADGDHTIREALCACCDDRGALSAAAASRRRFLKTSAAFLGGSAAAPLLPVRASAQGDADAELQRVQGARGILLKGAVVLTSDRQVGDFAQADVLVEDGKIREVSPNITASDDAIAVVDAGKSIVIPGFIDSHSHSYQGLLRGTLASGLLNPDYNRDVQTTLTPVYEPADAYAGVLVTALGMIDTGTTALVDISQVSHTPEHSDAVIRALQEAGIRAVYSYHRGAGPGSQHPQDIRRLQRTYFNSQDQLLTLALTGNLTANVHKVAREVGVPIVQHLVGTNLTAPLQALARDGLLWAGDEYIHCLGIDDAGWRLIKDTGGRVSICAAIDMTMGHGTPTIQEALDHGLRPSLSTDHSVTITQDFFSLMRTTFRSSAGRSCSGRARANRICRRSSPAVTCSSSPRWKGRAAPISTARSARSLRARKPISCCCGQTSQTSGRSTTPPAQS